MTDVEKQTIIQLANQTLLFYNTVLEKTADERISLKLAEVFISGLLKSSASTNPVQW